MPSGLVSVVGRFPCRGAQGADQVETVGYHPGRLQWKVTTEQPAQLVLAESYYPEWMAWVDGAPAKIYRTGIAFRRVTVPAGSHMVRMEFRPAILPISIAAPVGTAGCLGCFGWGGNDTSVPIDYPRRPRI